MGIYLSVVSPSKDLEQSKINKAITALAMKIHHYKQAGNMPANPQLDISFLLTSDLDKPDFEGMRMGGDKTDADSLYCEVAIPLEVVNSDYAADYVNAILFDAIDNANEFFTEMNNSKFDKQVWMSMAMSIINNTGETVVKH